MKLAFASVLILLSSLTAAFGQKASARITGRISDGTGAVIAGVAVKVTNADTNIAQTANSIETGDFTILYLPPGRYQLQAAAEGRNRTFFLFTWESLRLVDGKTQRGIVPDPGMLRGDFSKAVDAFGRPLRITDPLARAPFANNQIPLSRLDPVASKLATYFPAPNLSGPNNFISQGNGTNSFDNFGIKVEHLLTPKDRLTFSTFWRPNTVFDPVVNGRSPLPIFGLGNNTLDLLTYVRYLRTITPTMFLELSANFSRKTNNQVCPLSGQQDWGAASGFLGGTTNPVASGLPQIDASGYISLGPAYDVPKIWAFNNYQYAGTMTWVKGRHNIKYGADFLLSLRTDPTFLTTRA